MLDPRHQRLISIDWLGGSDASSGPRNDEEFVPVDSLDQAHAILLLLNHLGLAQVDAVIGSSYGGCVAQHLASGQLATVTIADNDKDGHVAAFGQ